MKIGVVEPVTVGRDYEEEINSVVWGNRTIRGQGTVFGRLAIIRIVLISSDDVCFRGMI